MSQEIFDPEQVQKNEEELSIRSRFQIAVAKHAVETGRANDPDEWLVAKSKFFGELYDNSDIEARYVKTQDTNPQELYNWVLDQIDKMSEGRE